MSFTLLTERDVPEINAHAKLFVHDKTGARLLSLTSEDENKSFGITFRTPPSDSTGIAHIMEHSVLCGSRKYPVKDPFVQLMKGSLNTFLNAFTYPDKTCYPCASQNLKDFYNLIDVYFDAVFYPLIPEHTLQQEGWHFELDDPSQPITFRGVVFNEMKGNYSSPDGLLGEKSQQSLFPNHVYGHDSGGNPEFIPDLTYAQFKAFHETYYHPSNSFIYFYGDDPEEERLRIAESWLKNFDRKEVNSAVPLADGFDEPRRFVHPYDAGEESGEEKKSYITVNWLQPETFDALTTLGLSILSHVLVGTPASPLHKALIDSGLGEDTTGGGYDDNLRQGYFSTGLKGVEEENLNKVETLILHTLKKLADDGIDPNTIAASMNTVEFHLREKNTGRFPRGLAYMLGALSTWLHDGDPFTGLMFEEPLNAIKEKITRGERYFESLIKKYFLNNLDRTTVILNPDPEEGKRRDEKEKARLAEAKAKMNASELEQVMDNARQLKARQETPDSPEALATIPSLKLSDLDKKIRTIPIEEIEVAGVKTLYHDLFTNGILYLDLGFDLHAVPPVLIPYVGFFGRLLKEMGTEREDFVRLIQRIGRDTGGIRSSEFTSEVRGANRDETRFFLRGKAMVPQATLLLDILKDLLLTVKLDNRDRFKQIILEEKSGLEAGLVPGGSGIVHSRLDARFTPSGWVSEQTGGISHLFFLRALIEKVDRDWDSVLNDLESLRRALINRAGMIVNVTLDASNWSAFRPQLDSFLQALPNTEAKRFVFKPEAVSAFEGLTIPAQVNYVGKGANLYKLGYQLHGSALVINNYLGTTWLWEKIRVQGGAYGGSGSFDTYSGLYTFLSYRDPNLLTSLDNYDGTANFLKKLKLSKAELTKSIIGTIGDLDAYLLPDAKGWASMARHLLGQTDEIRQKMRDEVLGTKTRDFKAFGEVLAQIAEKGEVVVLGSAEAINKANAERGNFLEVKKVL